MLPDSKSPSLELIVPTEQEVVTQQSKNGVEWKAALNLEAYLRREQATAQTALSRDSGISFWALVDKTQKPGARDVLAGCETLRKRALVSRKGQVFEAICHGVGSVFTPVEYRGHGYGARMMRELVEKLRTWQADSAAPGMLSVLYSDIGKKFYDKAGWKPFASSHIALSPRAAANGNSSTNGHANGHVNGHANSKANGELKNSEIKPLYSSDLVELCKADELMVRKRLARPRNNTAIVLIPDVNTMEWHHCREDFVANELFGNVPTIRGALTEANGRRIWIIFTRVYQNEDPEKRDGNVLHILRLVVEGNEAEAEAGSADDEETAKAISRLFIFAQEEAETWKCETVEIWNPQPRTLRAAQMLAPDAKIIDREQYSITSLKWYEESDGDVEWLENEKYGWC